MKTLLEAFPGLNVPLLIRLDSMTPETALVFPKRYLRVCLRREYSMEER